MVQVKQNQNNFSKGIQHILFEFKTEAASLINFYQIKLKITMTNYEQH